MFIVPIFRRKRAPTFVTEDGFAGEPSAVGATSVNAQSRSWWIYFVAYGTGTHIFVHVAHVSIEFYFAVENGLTVGMAARKFYHIYPLD